MMGERLSSKEQYEQDLRQQVLDKKRLEIEAKILEKDELLKHYSNYGIGS
jgi:hypothetical protein